MCREEGPLVGWPFSPPRDPPRPEAGPILAHYETREVARMSSSRDVTEVLPARPTLEGAGVRLKRAVGYDQVPRFDPFLLLDDIHSTDPQDYVAGFPWHPHRGIETVTCVVEGLVEHGDRIGNRGTIGSGDVQWMTAGSGIVHQGCPSRGEATGAGSNCG